MLKTRWRKYGSAISPSQCRKLCKMRSGWGHHCVWRPVTEEHPLKPQGLPVCFPVKNSHPAKWEASSSQVQGCPQMNGWISHHHLSFGHLPLYQLTAELFRSRTLRLLRCCFLEVSVLLEQYGWSQLLLSWQWCSFRHQRKCPRKDMVRLWPWLLSCPCSHCLWLSCFPATPPAGMMPVCYGDTFTSASSVKSRLLLIGLFPPHLVHDNSSTLLMKVRRGKEEQAVF